MKSSSLKTVFAPSGGLSLSGFSAIHFMRLKDVGPRTLSVRGFGCVGMCLYLMLLGWRAPHDQIRKLRPAEWGSQVNLRCKNYCSRMSALGQQRQLSECLHKV